MSEVLLDRSLAALEVDDPRFELALTAREFLGVREQGDSLVGARAACDQLRFLARDFL